MARRKEYTYEWNTHEVLHAATKTCKRCGGCGFHQEEICNCVFRNIFEVCHEQFKQSATTASTGIVTQGITCSRPTEDFAADFTLVGNRVLADRPLLQQVFQMYFLECDKWTVVALRNELTLPVFLSRRMKINNNLLFRRVFEVKVILGRAFRELQPYALYPLKEYFTKGTCNVMLHVQELLATPMEEVVEYTPDDEEFLLVA